MARPKTRSKRSKGRFAKARKRASKRSSKSRRAKRSGKKYVRVTKAGTHVFTPSKGAERKRSSRKRSGKRSSKRSGKKAVDRAARYIPQNRAAERNELVREASALYGDSPAAIREMIADKRPWNREVRGYFYRAGYWDT